MDDFMKALGYKALDSRLRRISEAMARDIKQIYKELQIDVEPNWYLVFMLLRDHQCLSIADIAERLRYAHPSVVVIVQKMEERGYVDASSDPDDKRKKLISLTEKAARMLPELERIWDSCENAILQVLDNDLAILGYMDRLESKLNATPFYKRFKNEYRKRGDLL
jgi:DNA-binding MarR family transcriptional regulator